MATIPLIRFRIASAMASSVPLGSQLDSRRFDSMPPVGMPQTTFLPPNRRDDDLPYLLAVATKKEDKVSAMKDEPMPGAFLNYAREYCKAANILFDANTTREQELFNPIYMLYSHATELALKAFLSSFRYLFAPLQKSGILECWNNDHWKQYCFIPAFQHSIIPFF